MPPISVLPSAAVIFTLLVSSSRMVALVSAESTCRFTSGSTFSMIFPSASSTCFTTCGCTRYPPLMTAQAAVIIWMGVVDVVCPKAEEASSTGPILSSGTYCVVPSSSMSTPVFS